MGGNGTGYLDVYELRDWYSSLSKEDQDAIYKYCSYGVNVDPEWLFTDASLLGRTAAMFLISLAYSAAWDRRRELAINCLSLGCTRKAPGDNDVWVEVWERKTREAIAAVPDQKDIDNFKPKIIDLVIQNPGILQVDIKKHFSEYPENLIGYAYSDLNRTGTFLREKAGRTFRVYIRQ